MHSLLIVISLGLALTVCLICLNLLRLARSATSRRALQVAGLLVPVLVLATLASLMVHFLSQVCFVNAPPGDAAIAGGLFAIGALGIVTAILLNVARALLLPVHLQRRTWDAPDWLRRNVETQAAAAGLRTCPRVRVAADARPWALVSGLYRPCLVVSGGMASLLDGDELEAVLWHELLHVRRGDLWWTALGALLRDLTWFLPVTHRLYALLLIEQEVACDDQVVGEQRRLALAGALARVWKYEISAGKGRDIARGGALAFFFSSNSSVAYGHFETRVRRLMDRQGTPRSANAATRTTLLALAAVLAVFVPLQVGVALLTMNSMGCGMNNF